MKRLLTVFSVKGHPNSLSRVLYDLVGVAREDLWDSWSNEPWPDARYSALRDKADLKEVPENLSVKLSGVELSQEVPQFARNTFKYYSGAVEIRINIRSRTSGEEVFEINELTISVSCSWIEDYPKYDTVISYLMKRLADSRKLIRLVDESLTIFITASEDSDICTIYLTGSMGQPKGSVPYYPPRFYTKVEFHQGKPICKDTPDMRLIKRISDVLNLSEVL